MTVPFITNFKKLSLELICIVRQLILEWRCSFQQRITMQYINMGLNYEWVSLKKKTEFITIVDHEVSLPR